METPRLSTLYANEHSGLMTAMNQFSEKEAERQILSPGREQYIVDDLEVIVTHLPKELETLNRKINIMQNLAITDDQQSKLYSMKQKRNQLICKKKCWQNYRIQIQGPLSRVEYLSKWMQKQGARQTYKTVQ